MDETISAYKLAKIEKRAPITIRRRGLRGLYGRLASTRPMRFHLDELHKRNLLPDTTPRCDATEVARDIFNALIEAYPEPKDFLRAIEPLWPVLLRLVPCAAP